MTIGYSFGTFLIALTFVVHFALQILAAFLLRRVRRRIGGNIKSQSDLDEVKVAIQTNMSIAMILICNGLIMFAAIFLVGAWTFASCLGALSVVLALTVTGRIEKQFKTLSVKPGLEDLELQYRAYVQQWTGFNIFLKPEKGGHERDSA